MGKVHSLMKINGKVGDFVYYKLNGKDVARRVAKKRRGPKTKGEQRRALMNREFGEASKAARRLREALAPECDRLNDRDLYLHVARLMVLLKSWDNAPPGACSMAGGLATLGGRQLLADFNFHKKAAEFPKLLSAERQSGKLHLLHTVLEPRCATLIELQINFENGKFRRYECGFPQEISTGKLILKKQLRRKKGFTDLVMVSGEGFLQGVAVSDDSSQ